MKQIVFSIIVSLLTVSLSAQNFSKISNIKYKKAEDYKKYEPQILECTNYLFSKPFDKKDPYRSIASVTIVKWMEGTPDYTFNLDAESLKITKGSKGLFSMYMAALTKAVLVDPNKKLSDAQIQEKATKYMVEYTANSENNLKPSKALKKL